MYAVRFFAGVEETYRRMPPELKTAAKEALKANPLLGKPLEGDLAEFRSVRFLRYRIVYRIDIGEKVVWVYGIGHRSRSATSEVTDTFTGSSPLSRFGTRAFQISPGRISGPCCLSRAMMPDTGTCARRTKTQGALAPAIPVPNPPASGSAAAAGWLLPGPLV